MDLASVGGAATPAQLEDCYRRKTGALIAASVQIGALTFETANSTLIDALTRFGQAVGLAFQIADDILDVEGTAEILGKPAGADGARGKPTYPSVLGLENAKTEARRLYTEALESLGALDDNGRPLADIANFVLARRR